MANPSTLYRFRLDVSDVDRGFYEKLDFRVAMHPSETSDYLITRVLAYALNFESGLEFSAGLSTSDEPAIGLRGKNGAIVKWIEIGNPSARKLHKAAKAAKVVRVYTYKNPENLKREMEGESIHRASEIEVFSLRGDFLAELSQCLKRDNAWGVIHTDGELVVTVGEGVFIGALEGHRLGG